MGEGNSLKRQIVITIDGPAGAGKSATAKLLSQYLGYKYLDTGAIYRTVAWCALREGIPLDDAGALAGLCRRIKIDFSLQKGELRVVCNGEDVSHQIRAMEMGMHASTVSAHPQVRAELLALQRNLAKEGGIVAEGRDVGSVVFPEADIKFYLDASPEIRSKRYFRQQGESREKLELEEIMRKIKKRDEQDRSRANAPLIIPDGAIVINNDNINAEETVCKILSLLKGRFPDIVLTDKERIYNQAHEA